jgi:rRNA maturation RNase YbeY
MSAVKFSFFVEDVAFKVPQPRKTSQWLKNVVAQTRNITGEVNYIFCSDQYLLELNQQYLDHDTYTDIITFDQSETPDFLQADIFISIERVQENAKLLGVSFQEELDRVIVHGLLHLIGEDDKTPEKAAKMRAAENYFLALKNQMPSH